RQTSYLPVCPDENIAKTDRPVTITDAATVVNAIGLEMNSDTRILKLHSRVQGTYDPNLAPKKSAGKSACGAPLAGARCRASRRRVARRGTALVRPARPRGEGGSRQAC